MNAVPKQPYGYLSPKLGGEGMVEKRSTDLYWEDEYKRWEKVASSKLLHEELYYTRPIMAGEGYRIVELSEFFGHDKDGRIKEYGYESTLDGINWTTFNSWHIMSMPVGVKWALKNYPNILAIRTRIETPKEPEWPKYWQCSLGGLIRQLAKGSSYEYTSAGHWSNFDGSISTCDKPISIGEAMKIMNQKTYKNTYLETKQDPTPKKTNDQQFESGWLKKVLDEASKSYEEFQAFLNKKPNWRPITECDLDKFEPFHAYDGEKVTTFNHGVESEDIEEYLLENGYTHFLRCEGIYQVPPPPPEPEKVEPMTWEQWYDSIDNTKMSEKTVVRLLIEAIKQGKVKVV